MEKTIFKDHGIRIEMHKYKTMVIGSNLDKIKAKSVIIGFPGAG